MGACAVRGHSSVRCPTLGSLLIHMGSAVTDSLRITTFNQNYVYGQWAIGK